MSDEAVEGSFEVEEEMNRVRADKVLCAQLPEMSRSRVQQIFEDGHVWRDEVPLSKNEKLRTGDLISYEIPPAKPAKLRAVDIPLRVIYEDEHMIAVNKAPGMVVHPGAGTGEDTLVHALLHHCKGELSGIGGEERPGIVHRLDKETSGVIVAAKSDRAFLGLSKAFAERLTVKHYLALVSVCPGLPGGTIDFPIGRNSMHRQKMCVRDDGRSAQTDWEVVERFGTKAALLRIRIHTGRTHQIRVHMAYVEHPLAGDTVYGWQANSWIKDSIVPRVMLHAWTLELPHPITGELLKLEAPQPDDFQTVTAQLRALV